MAESALYPNVAAGGSVWASESDVNRDDQWKALLPPSLSPGNSGSGDAVRLGALWEADRFGGRHADADAARPLSESTARTAQGIRSVVAADVVENYQQLAGLRQRLAIFDLSIATASQLADYVGARMETGAATAADLTRARSVVASLRASRAPLLSLIDARRRRLAVLTGDLPEQVGEMSASSSFAVPPAPTGQLPSTILERRPDVEARSWRVRAQIARLKSLKADLLPRFSIAFLGQNGRIGIGGLPGVGGTGGVIGLSASVPIFTAGRLQARVTAGNAELEAAMADYDKSVLSALEEVESAYGFRAGMDQNVEGLAGKFALSSRHAEQMEALYQAGRTQRSELLQARLDALADEDKLAQARIAQGTATVQLYRTLGGDWHE